MWLTFQLLPPTEAGLGQVLRPGRRAALAWSELIKDSELIDLYQPPELDIVSYFPAALALSEIDRLSGQVLDAGMAAPPAEAIFVATYTVSGAALGARGHTIESDIDSGRILRSVLMKPESELIIPDLHAGIEALVTGRPTG